MMLNIDLMNCPYRPLLFIRACLVVTLWLMGNAGGIFAAVAFPLLRGYHVLKDSGHVHNAGLGIVDVTNLLFQHMIKNHHKEQYTAYNTCRTVRDPPCQ